MKINNVDGNDIVLDHGVIGIECDWLGGSQVSLSVTLFINSKDEHYECDSIEHAFNRYYEIVEDI